MKLITIALLTIFLTSCKTKIVCKQIKKNQIDYVVIHTVKMKYNSCKVQCFDLNNWKTVSDNYCGDNFESGNYPLEECDQVQGFFVNDMATEIRPKIKDLARVRRDYCKF
jgi:hypothetical protein